MITNISKIKRLIISYGKCVITIDDDKKDYLFNGKDPYSIPKDIFKNGLTEFHQLLAKQLAEQKFDDNIAKKLSKLINQQKEKNNLVQERRIINWYFDRNLINKSNSDITAPTAVSANAEITNKRIQELLLVQEALLNKMNSLIKELGETSLYIIDDDIKKLTSESKESAKNIVELADIGKMHFNLNKKDTITLLTLLEHLDILSFQKTKRNKFIESNITYLPNTNKPSDIKKMNSDLANLHDIKGELGLRNKTSYNNLVKRLMKKIKDTDYTNFASWLKDTI
tara:strand:+ start:3016 stop:3864 length:849 start_codon:yes stop_codon:yes gene_type:complete